MTQPDNSKAPQMVVPVVNNREALHSIQLRAKDADGKGRTAGETIHLLPGLNFVPADKWAMAKANPQVAEMLEDKIPPAKAPEQNPECVGKPYLVERKPVERDNPLASMSESEAVMMVGELFDVPTARRLFDQEARPRVVAALKQQITKIERPSELAQQQKKK